MAKETFYSNSYFNYRFSQIVELVEKNLLILKYIKEYNDSQYAQEFNLDTKQLKSTSKRNYKLKIHDAVRLAVGRVLFANR